MSTAVRLLVVAVFTTIAPAQIWNVSTDASGRDVYFVTNLSQRESGQPAVYKVFLLRGRTLTLIEQTPADYPFGPGTYFYTRGAVSANGDVLVVNRRRDGACPSSCRFYESASTLIQAPYATFTFAANTALSANGRFAALFGNTNEAPGVSPPGH